MLPYCMHHQQTTRAPASFPLTLANEGERVQISFLPCGNKIRERLLSMGIQQGDIIQVIHKHPGGATLVEKQGIRYALGGGMSHKINVIRYK